MSRRQRHTLSVVMPYYENQRTLRASLESFCTQSHPPDEIVVVDDGSPHHAAPIVAATSWAVPVYLHHSSHAGQSAATNVGIRAARGDLVLLTCADIVADKDLLKHHAQAHVTTTQPIAVLGHIPYAPNVPMTPFMRFLAAPGPQFCFEQIMDADNVAPQYCYAPNFSVARHDLLRVGLFDESFVYGYQDTDLGRRLVAGGVRIVYRKQAIGLHDHPNSVRAFVKRQHSVGKATLRMLEKYPDPKMREYLHYLVERLGPILPRLDSMVCDAETLEAKVAHVPLAYEAVRVKLHELYNVLLTMAMVQGMLSEPERTHQLLQQDATDAHRAH